MKKVLVLLTVLLLCSVIHAQEVRLVNTTNTWDDGGTKRLLPNCETTFYIDFINNTDIRHGGFTTGFELYTPGASGISTILNGDTLPSGIPWKDRYSLGVNIDLTQCDGTYPEIIGFSGAGLPFDPGFEAGEVLHISITANAPKGGILCLDSSFFDVVGTWVWGAGYYPSWDGPHCFQAILPGHIPVYMYEPDSIYITECNSVNYSGFVTDPLVQPTSDEDIKILEGPGYFAYDPFRWQWDFTELPTEPVRLIIGLYDWAKCYDEIQVCTTYITPYTPPELTNIPDYINLEGCCHGEYDFHAVNPMHDHMFEILSGPGEINIIDNGETARWSFDFNESTVFPINLQIGIKGAPCENPYDTVFDISVYYCPEITQNDCLQLAYQPDTLYMTGTNRYSLFLNGTDACGSGPYTFTLLDGPGAIDPETNKWVIQPTIADSMSVTSITIEAQQFCYTNTFTFPVKYTYGTSYFAGDVNADGSKDISDLLYLVDYFFADPPGPPPLFPIFSDCNNSGTLDISDLLMMVDYFFGDGPACNLD